MFLSFPIFISLIIELSSKEFIMKKNTNDNNAFNPYIFKYNFKNEKENNYSFIFDTSSYIIWEGNNTIYKNETIAISTITGEELSANEICINDYFCWFKTNKEMKLGYIGVIGISNKNRNIFINRKDEDDKDKNKNYYLNYYLNSFDIKKEERYINFIQKNNNDALMIFGKNNNIFNKDNSKKCQCKKKNNKNENNEDNNIFWCCELSSIKIGENDIYLSSNNNEYGIFAINEEYIIGPRAGFTLLNYYEKLIKDTFGVNCIKENNNRLIYLKCDYFNYNETLDLSFIMKGDIRILAMSQDLFKMIDNDNLELKIKINNNTKDNAWYLGDPIVKNYNLLLNYTNLSDISLIIIPSNLNGFILVTIAMILGFILLIIFIIIIYILKRGKNKNEKYTFFSSENWKKDRLFSFHKNPSLKNNCTELIEKIDEENLEDSENNKNSINNIETNSFNNLKEINKDENNIGNELNNNFNDNNAIKKNINKAGTLTSVEFSLNDFVDENDDDDDIFMRPPNKK